MLLYHFVSTQHALNAIDEQAIKVSNFDNLNDPFELQAAGSGQREVRVLLEFYRKALSKAYRMLCCSKSWESPVVWGHYADSHRGAALVLDTGANLVKDVDYVKDRKMLRNIDINVTDFTAALENIDLLTTKYEQWSYEDEARILFKPDGIKKYGGLEFADCALADMKIVGIVLGPLNNTDEDQISAVIPSGMSMWYTKARLADKSYKVVSDISINRRWVASSKE